MPDVFWVFMGILVFVGVVFILMNIILVSGGDN